MVSASPPLASSPPWWHRPTVAAVLLAIAAGLAYHNSWHVPFVFDDELSIPGNPTLRSLAQAWSPPADAGITVGGRPLLNFTLALNYAISGTDPWSYHACNFAIQLAAGLMLFGIVRRTLSRAPCAVRFGRDAFGLAVAVSALWTLHPLQTESVTYVIQRAESLMSLCYVTTVWAFVRGMDASSPARARWFGLAWFACLAGMATKEVMATAPLIVALYDRVFVAGGWRALWRERKGFYAGLASTWLLLALLVLGNAGRGGTFDLTSPSAWWRYDLTQIVALVHYIRLMLWPWPLVLDYGTFWIARLDEVLVPGLVLLGVAPAIIVAWRRAPSLGFLGAWFFVIIAPSTLPPGTIQMIVEHRLHLPLAAAMVGLVLAMHQIAGRRFGWVVLGIAVPFIALTARRNEDYATPIRLFEDTVVRRPGNARAMALLGDYYRRAGRLDDARRLLERSLATEPSVVPVLNNLGNVYQELGDSTRALGCFNAALAKAPTDITTLNNLGNALMQAGRTDEGLARLRRGVELAPAFTGARLNLANALAQAGQFPAAADEFARVIRQTPDEADVHAMYAAALQELRRSDEALTELRTAVRLRPTDPLLHDRLGTALGRAGLLREALAEFEAALRLNPADENARQNAAVAARRLGLR